MSLTINMVGGGGSSLQATDAVLRVQAPAGSTVTITKGGTTKTGIGFVNSADNSVYDYYFIIKQSEFNSTAWTITGTLSGQGSASTTIVINASKEYYAELSYKLWLYNAGNEYTSVTGGWIQRPTVSGYVASGTFTKNSDNIYSKSVSMGSSAISTTNAIDLTGYSTLHIKFKVGSGSQARYKIATELPTSGEPTTISASTSYQTITLDISSYSGSYFFALGDMSSHNGVYLQQAWLA